VSQLLRHESNEWDEGTLRRYFFHWDMEEIMKIRLPVNKRSDWFARQYKKTGIFSVRSVYKLALTRDHDLDAVGTSVSASRERSVWKKIWKLPILPKVCNFIWKVSRNGLPTNANRRYRHIAEWASCHICDAECEDYDACPPEAVDAPPLLLALVSYFFCLLLPTCSALGL
jgi:hypothetical protein